MRRMVLCFGLLALGPLSCWEKSPGRGEARRGSGPESAMQAPARAAPDSRPARDRLAAGPVDEARAKTQALRLFGHLGKKDYAKAHALFSEAMKKGLPEPKVKEIWEQLVSGLGEHRSVEVLKSETHKTWRRQQIRGVFAKSAVIFSVSWTPAGELDGFFVKPEEAKFPPWEPPLYARADQVREIPITVGEGPLALPGLLTVPTARGGKRYPAVILVHGSGPQDRDETLGPNKPFKDLAWGLAAQGIAVLRYDKVTKAHPAKSVELLTKGFTMDHETTNDALVAAELLRKHELVEPGRVFFLGHSQGAMAGPRAGARDPRLAGIILLAGPTRPFAEVGLAQLEYIMSLGGPQGLAVAKILGEYRVQMKVMNDPSFGPDTPAKRLPFGIPASFWLDLRGYHPEKVAAGLRMPVLVLQGEADYQVTMEDFAGWKRALAKKGNAVCRSFPRLGHHFIDLGKAKAVPQDYFQTTGHVAQEVVEEIVRFAKEAR